MQEPWVSYRVRRTSNGTGLGLFATKGIPRGEFIIEYVGERIKTEIADTLGTKYLFDLENGLTIDGSGRENCARYINHSCDPNAETEIVDEQRVVIIALRSILSGEEITYDYGDEYFDEFLRGPGCRCATCIKSHPSHAV